MNKKSRGAGGESQMAQRNPVQPPAVGSDTLDVPFARDESPTKKPTKPNPKGLANESDEPALAQKRPLRRSKAVVAKK